MEFLIERLSILFLVGFNYDSFLISYQKGLLPDYQRKLNLIRKICLLEFAKVTSLCGSAIQLGLFLRRKSPKQIGQHFSQRVIKRPEEAHPHLSP